MHTGGRIRDIAEITNIIIDAFKQKYTSNAGKCVQSYCFVVCRDTEGCHVDQ